MLRHSTPQSDYPELTEKGLILAVTCYGIGASLYLLYEPPTPTQHMAATVTSLTLQAAAILYIASIAYARHKHDSS